MLLDVAVTEVLEIVGHARWWGPGIVGRRDLLRAYNLGLEGRPGVLVRGPGRISHGSAGEWSLPPSREDVDDCPGGRSLGQGECGSREGDGVEREGRKKVVYRANWRGKVVGRAVTREQAGGRASGELRGLSRGTDLFTWVVEGCVAVAVSLDDSGFVWFTVRYGTCSSVAERQVAVGR